MLVVVSATACSRRLSNWRTFPGHSALITNALPLLAGLYVISPLDLIPDVIPVLGQLDDLGIILIALEAFLRLCPPAALMFHRAAIAQSRGYSPMSPTGDFIDTEWRHEE